MPHKGQRTCSTSVAPDVAGFRACTVRCERTEALAQDVCTGNYSTLFSGKFAVVEYISRGHFIAYSDTSLFFSVIISIF